MPPEAFSAILNPCKNFLLFILLDGSSTSHKENGQLARAQDQLDEAIGIIRETAGGLDGDLKQRSEGAASSMEVHREKFFFQSLTGLPFAVKANKGAKASAASASDDTVAVLEAVAAEIDDKADAPGTVLT